MFWSRGGGDSVKELQVNELASREAELGHGVGAHRVGDAYDDDEESVPFCIEAKRR